MLDVYDIIAKKRDGLTLRAEEIEAFVNAFVRGEVPEYQMSAFLMAVYFSGMRDAETHALANAMAHSGDLLDLSGLGELTVDKHSTGGVGDKTTLIVAPICRAAGLTVAKMSGRGLGHTGGTIDKLESIPGFKTNLSRSEFYECVRKNGIVVAGQSANLAPADKKMYALRDATATVESIPLIAASIMSKKLAAGAKSIVLDVKTGSGALMKSNVDAAALAHQMVDIAHRANRRCMALVTDMSRPLGNHVGNSLEVMEAISILQGADGDGDLAKLCIQLAGAMIHLAKGISMGEALGVATDALASGKAYDAFRLLIAAQGGDLRYVDDPELLEVGGATYQILADRAGFVEDVNTESIGRVARVLGAGRIIPDAAIDYGAGIVFHKKSGDYVQKGDLIAVLYAKDELHLSLGIEQSRDLFTVGDVRPPDPPLIHDCITADDLYDWD